MVIRDLILFFYAFDTSDTAEYILHVLSIIHIQKNRSFFVKDFFILEFKSNMFRSDKW